MRITGLMLIAIAMFTTVTAQAGPGNKTHFKARLAGAFEVPPVETETRGMAKFRFNRDFSYMYFTLVVREGIGVLGANGAHLHCAPAGENGPVVVALAGESMPGFDGTLVLRAGVTDANVAGDTDCGPSLLDLAESMLEGNVYVNVHTSDFPAGEVRGQLKGNNGKGNDKKDDDDDG